MDVVKIMLWHIPFLRRISYREFEPQHQMLMTLGRSLLVTLRASRTAGGIVFSWAALYEHLYEDLRSQCLTQGGQWDGGTVDTQLITVNVEVGAYLYLFTSRKADVSFYTSRLTLRIDTSKNSVAKVYCRIIVLQLKKDRNCLEL